MLPAIVEFGLWTINRAKIKNAVTDLRKRLIFYFFISAVLITVVIFIFYFLKNRNRPNVILITIDALRADHLSCYGYKRLTSPHIDKFAKEGAMFLQAIAPSTDTFYSIPIIMTSTYSHYYGVEKWNDCLINSSVLTLAEIVSNNGYCTALFSNGPFFSIIKGADRGFKTVVNENISADKLTNSLSDWLRFNKKRKFFLWIHYFDTHAPYLPPSPYNMLYVHDKLNTYDRNIPIASSDKILVGLDVIPYFVAKNNITSVNYYISQYDGEIRFIDEQIGILLDKLNEFNLDKNTLIVITSDHGESLVEHNRYFQHGGMPFDTILRVPLIFKYDSIIPKNKKIKEQVSSVDILPTILKMVRIKCPGDIEGRSFFGLLQGKIENRNPYAFSKGAASVYSLRTKKWKLIYLANSGRYYLYDIENDKDELNNIKDIKNNEFKFLSKKLNEWIENDKKKSIAPVKSSKMPPLDRDTIEKLKSLGYIGG